ncbi:MAG: HEPN domain-containing protein [Anaerolineales bacterium]|nr:MAG: HEPN domain-containing protein [Anaerolineales bacterium]
MTEIKTGAPTGVLRPEEAQAVEEFKEKLLAALPDQVRDIILFGSKARGDGYPESDIDLLVVLENPTKEQINDVCNVTTDILFDKGIDLSAITFSRKEIERLCNLGTPLVQNVTREGIVIIGEGIVAKEAKKEEIVQQFLASAKEDLEPAVFLESGGFHRIAVSRAYYAFLDAADGALVAKGFTPKSHADTISLFGLQFVETGLVDRKYGRWFNLAKKARLDADYERHKVFTAEDAREAIEQATEFVEVIEKLLPSLREE